jgi:hypothetical protein
MALGDNVRITDLQRKRPVRVGPMADRLPVTADSPHVARSNAGGLYELERRITKTLAYPVIQRSDDVGSAAVRRPRGVDKFAA